MIYTMRELKIALRACRTVRDVGRVAKLARPGQLSKALSWRGYTSRQNPGRWQTKVSKRAKELR
jgi:hypothetical protein